MVAMEDSVIVIESSKTGWKRQTAEQEAIVKHFENNNEEYNRIERTVKEKVHKTLSNIETVLELALLSLIDYLMILINSTIFAKSVIFHY
jgi:hypothetical protein